jgi:hypothetical protein
MVTRNTPTQTQLDQVVALLEDTGVDLFDVLIEVFTTWDDRAVLALLPAKTIEEAITYLRYKHTEQASAYNLQPSSRHP